MKEIFLRLAVLLALIAFGVYVLLLRAQWCSAQDLNWLECMIMFGG